MLSLNFITKQEYDNAIKTKVEFEKQENINQNVLNAVVQ
jgi:hypothetical protein